MQARSGGAKAVVAAARAQKADSPPTTAVSSVGATHADRAPAIDGRDDDPVWHTAPSVTEFRQFPDRGHSLTVDSGWREVAQAVLDWLSRQGIEGRTPQP